MRQTVLIVQPIAKCGEDYLTERGYRIIKGSGVSETDIASAVRECDGMLVRNARITPTIINAASKLKVIGRHGVGVDTIDVDYCQKKGVWVTNAPLSNSNAVAEHTMFLLLSCAKNAHAINTGFRSGDFEIRHEITNLELAGKTLAVIGLGRIGRNIAKKAIYGLDMKVVGYDAYADRALLDDGILLVNSLKDALQSADFVTIHLPLNSETKGLFNRQTFAQMKQGSFLINTARGELIVEHDLLEALEEGRLAGGGFDLLAKEPPPKDHPLFANRNVILTPHNAAHTSEAFRNMALHAAQGIHEVLSGQTPTWPVNMPR